jgi:hypothetical protein
LLLGDLKADFSEEQYTVDVRRDPSTGTITREQWRQNDELDRADGPAVITRNAATGTVTYDVWYRGGTFVSIRAGSSTSVPKPPVPAV